MKRKIEIDLEEAKRVFLLIEKMNHFFHQPLHFDDSDEVKSFALKVYPEIKEVYYDIIWDWLPKDIQEEIENR